mgnify:CR=1 FL=1
MGRLEKKRNGRNKGLESQKPTRKEEKAKKSVSLGAEKKGRLLGGLLTAEGKLNQKVFGREDEEGFASSSSLFHCRSFEGLAESSEPFLPSSIKVPYSSFKVESFFLLFAFLCCY